MALVRTSAATIRASSNVAALAVSPPSLSNTKCRSSVAPENSVFPKTMPSYTLVLPLARSCAIAPRSAARSVVSGLTSEGASANATTPTGTSAGSSSRKLTAASLAAPMASFSFMLPDVSRSITTSSPSVPKGNTVTGTDCPSSRMVTSSAPTGPSVRPEATDTSNWTSGKSSTSTRPISIPSELCPPTTPTGRTAAATNTTGSQRSAVRL